jgi:streptomycin 3"-adenylyltransferase
MDELIAPVLDHLDRKNPGEIVGVYLYGSATAAGLRPDSDIDLLVLTRRSLTIDERAALISLLLTVSGWGGHSKRFSEVADRRPIELTSVVIDDDDQSWRHKPRHDFQYGEWLREDLINGHIPHSEDDPDVITLIATAQLSHRVLRGPALSNVVTSVTPDLLKNAVLAVIPDILEDIDGDERNTLLALARILVTLATGEIVSKDAAAEAIAPTLTAPDRDLLQRARAGYLATAADDWTGLTTRVVTLAHTLADRAKQHHR